MTTNWVVETSSRRQWNTTHCCWDFSTQLGGCEDVEMFPGLAGDHPATTCVVERDALSQETTCGGIRRIQRTGKQPSDWQVAIGLASSHQPTCSETNQIGKQPSTHMQWTQRTGKQPPDWQAAIRPHVVEDDRHCRRSPPMHSQMTVET